MALYVSENNKDPIIYRVREFSPFKKGNYKGFVLDCIIDSSGLFYGILLTAIISMDLAIVNFLPIPALDGGQLLFLAVEKAMGRKVGAKVMEWLATISFFLLIGLMLVVVFNDIWALVTQKI